MSVALDGEASLFWLFWFEVAVELLLLAMRDTMEVGEVVSEEADEFEAEELVLEFELVEVRMVDEVTEVGGVLAERSEPFDSGEPAANWAPSWLVEPPA